MTHDRFHHSSEERTQPPAEFESRIARSAPQPREDFQAELAGQLLKAFAQRRHPRSIPAALLSRQSRQYGRLSWRAAAVLIAILMIGIGTVIAVSSALQQFISFDAGLKAIYEQGHGHEIGSSQTQDGFTVTLEWAYADGNRLTLAYSIAGHPGTPYTNLSSDQYTLTLRDTGTEIPFIQGMSSLLDANGELVISAEPVTSDRSLHIMTHDLSAIETSSRSSLDLRLEVDAYGITLQQRTLMPIEAFNAMKEGPEELFSFDFSVALVNEQRVFDTALTASDQDVTVSLRRVSVSPSQTRVVVCFLPPDPARQWTAVPVLTTAEGEVQGGGGVRTFMEGELACNDYTYFSGMYDYTGAWRLEVTELIGFGSGGGSDQQRIAGSWVFDFVVP